MLRKQKYSHYNVSPFHLKQTSVKQTWTYYCNKDDYYNSYNVCTGLSLQLNEYS